MAVLASHLQENASTEPSSNASRHPDSAAPDVLTSSQLHALFDILTHHEIYAEVEQFKLPATISSYGYPFKLETAPDGTPLYAAESSTPLLAGLLRSILLPVPGVRDLPAEFWHKRFQAIMVTLGEAELSESYDKGALGTRKTLATAASVIHESVSRGILGGIAKDGKRSLDGSYDRSKAEDLVRAWNDGVHELVHGDLVDELFDCAAEMTSLEDHSPGVQAAADYIIVHMATFLHRVFVLSPEGPYLLKLLENIHSLIPYTMIRQTLRVGNAASMLNGMMSLLLAKMGVGAIANWLGLTKNMDDGMNLLQRIISLVLSWDSSEYRKSADKIERMKEGPSKEHLSAIKQYIGKPRAYHDEARAASVKSSTSMVAKILELSSPDLLASSSKAQLTHCNDYLVALLAIRDREELTKALCRGNPDHFTDAIRNVVASYEPIIRGLHERVDLREHVSAAESFLTDFIATSKPKRNGTGPSSSGAASDTTTSAPAVEDYVNLLRRSRQLLYNWLNQVASKCPDIRDDFRAWAKQTMKIFRQSKRDSAPTEEAKHPEEDKDSNADVTRRNGAAGALNSNLQSLFAALPESSRSDILAAVDSHASYLSSLEKISLRRMQSVLDNIDTSKDMTKGSSGKSSPAPKGASMCGPGMFMARWQQLLDETVLGPAVPSGPLRCGKDLRSWVPQANTATLSSAVKDRWDHAALSEIGEKEMPHPPKVQVVVDSLRLPFRKLLVDLLKAEHE